MSILLSEASVSRDNNFNLIRFTAALMVIIYHSYPLTGTSGGPLHAQGISLGHIAVDIFFVTSGFLITGSMITRNNLVAFIVARILRIYPALIVAVLFCVFIVGLLFTTQSVESYLSNPTIYSFLKNNSLLVVGPLHWNLPNVFEMNPYKMAVNGSLWTLPFEIQMYAILAFLGMFLVVSPYMVSKRTFTILVVGIALISMVAFLTNQIMQFTQSYNYIFTSRFAGMFFTGGAIFLLKDKFLLSHRIFGTCIALLLYFSDNPTVFMTLYSLTIAYLVIYLAYIPSGIIRNFNRLGDYSYGLYIYAFPVQQMIAATVVGVSMTTMTIIALPLTLILAVLSWHTVEKPMLKKKDCYITIQAYLYKLPFFQKT